MAGRKRLGGGKSEDKLMGDALRVALMEAATDANGKPTRRLRLVAERLVLNAMAGDTAAISMIFDRVDGKVPNSLPIDPNTGRPGRIVIGWLDDDGPQMLAIEPPREENNG